MKVKLFEEFKVYKFEDLSNILLKEGGEEVHSVFEEDLYKLIENGDFYDPDDYRYEIITMKQSKCHTNCSLFYQNFIEENSEDEISLMTGWALSENNIWYQHSWIWLHYDDIIIETTEPRKLYYGIQLKYSDLGDFLSDNV